MSSEFRDRFMQDLAKAGLSTIRESGLILVPHSPTGSMLRAARNVLTPAQSLVLKDEQIEHIYFIMTQTWVTKDGDQSAKAEGGKE